jgi:hypothetical protein
MDFSVVVPFRFRPAPASFRPVYSGCVTKPEIEALRRAVERAHPCRASFVSVDAVHERHEGATVWRGEVATFALADLPSATQAYAWASRTTPGRANIHVVLRAAHIATAADAVRAAIALRVQQHDASKKQFS